MIPLLNSLASGENAQLAGWFQVTTVTEDGVLILQTGANNETTELYLEITYEHEPHSFFSNELPEGSQRAREGLGTAIRSLALETLCKITGPAVKEAIKEIILCATIPSPDVYSSVSEALRRVAVPAHTDVVRDIVWLPESYQVASASLDQTIKIWDTQYGSLVRTIRSPRGTVLALGAHPVLKDVVISANGDGSFSLWDTSSGKEMLDQPYARRQIGSLSLSLQGNAFISVDDLDNACMKSERAELRMWALCQPPTVEEILDNDRIRIEHRLCAQALAACNPAGLLPSLPPSLCILPTSSSSVPRLASSVSERTRLCYHVINSLTLREDLIADPEPSRARKLVFPLIERMVMIGLPAGKCCSWTWTQFEGRCEKYLRMGCDSKLEKLESFSTLALHGATQLGSLSLLPPHLSYAAIILQRQSEKRCRGALTRRQLPLVKRRCKICTGSSKV